MAIGNELHANEESMLLLDGFRQVNLWGINIYPEQNGDDRIEFDSMINIRPSLGNCSLNVEDSGIQKRIIEIVNQLIKGWINYFGIAISKSAIVEIEELLSTRLHVIRWKEWKRTSTRIRELIKLGAPAWGAYQLLTDEQKLLSSIFQFGC